MASAEANRTVWTLAIFGACLFLFVKLFPALKAALSKSSGGGGPVGAGGGGYGYPGNPQPQQQTGRGPGSAPLGTPQQQDVGVAGNLANFINNTLNQGWKNAANIPIDNSALVSLDKQGLNFQMVENLDDLPTWNPYEADAPSEDDETASDEDDFAAYEQETGGSDIGGGGQYDSGGGGYDPTGGDGGQGYEPGEGGGMPD